MLGYFRLILAFGVLLAHANLLSPGVSRTMVAAFFVVSGYLIGLTLSANYSANPLPFYRNRILRIYPLHVIVSVVLLLLWQADGADAIELTWIIRHDAEPGTGDIVRSFLLTREDGELFNPPAWTLFYELAFYAVAPLLVLGRGAVWLAASATTLVLLGLWGKLDLLAEPFGFDPSDRAMLASAAALFLLGLAVFNARKLAPNPFGRAARYVEAGAVAALIAMLALSMRFVTHDDLEGFDADYDNAVYLTTLALTVVLLLAWDRDRGLGKWAADLTYPVYLLHWPILYLLLGEQETFIDLQRNAVDAVRPALSNVFGGGEPTSIVVKAAFGAVITLAVSYVWLLVERRTFTRLRGGHRPRNAPERRGMAVGQAEPDGALAAPTAGGA